MDVRQRVVVVEVWDVPGADAVNGLLGSFEIFRVKGDREEECGQRRCSLTNEASVNEATIQEHDRTESVPAS